MYKISDGLLIPEANQLEKIGKGLDGIVYRYLDYAIKIFIDRIPCMDLDKLKRFINGLVHALLLTPKAAVFNDQGDYIVKKYSR